MKPLDYIKEIINTLFVFSSINDNYMVIHFGDSVLKFIFVLFVIVNVSAFTMSWNYLRKERWFLAFIFTILISFAVNLMNYPDAIVPLFKILSLISIFIIFIQHPKPSYIMMVYIISAAFSSYLCITSTDTIFEWSFRKSGGTADPNEYSLSVLIPMFYLFGVLSRSKFRYFLAALPLFALYVVGLLYAGSKSAFISLAFALVFFCIFVLKFSIRKKIIILSSFIILLGVGYALLAYCMGDLLDLFLERFEDDDTAQERFMSWQVGFEILKDNLMFGVGPVNYGNTVGIIHPEISETSRAAHNMFIQAIVELGIPGFVVFISFLSKPFKFLFKKRLSVEYALGLIALLPMCCTLSTLYEKYLWLFLALVFNVLRCRKKTVMITVVEKYDYANR